VEQLCVHRYLEPESGEENPEYILGVDLSGKHISSFKMAFPESTFLFQNFFSRNAHQIYYETMFPKDTDQRYYGFTFPKLYITLEKQEFNQTFTIAPHIS